MSAHIHRFLPTAGDGRNIAGFGSVADHRPVDIGQPYPEAAYRFGGGVLPLLRRSGMVADRSAVTGPAASGVAAS
jgi:hypothetical protein